jgi:hypothetical protein
MQCNKTRDISWFYKISVYLGKWQNQRIKVRRFCHQPYVYDLNFTKLSLFFPLFYRLTHIPCFVPEYRYPFLELTFRISHPDLPPYQNPAYQ